MKKHIAKIFTIFLFLVTTTITQAQNITVIGIGRLGLSLALSLENAGYNVLGVDVNSDYVSKLNDKSLESPEPFINEYLSGSSNFRATTSLEEGLNFSDVCMILVSTTYGTPAYNFDILTSLLSDINSFKISNKHLIICSTVFPGYIANTALPLLKDCSDVVVSYNPPFIAQGTIINGLRKPDMVLIGGGSPEATTLLTDIYQSVCLNSPYMAQLSVPSAEITKLALNSYVTAKIAFANLVGDIADETPGADKIEILNALGKDQRIGSKYFKPGYGFGGPCFVRDNNALICYARTRDIDPATFVATDQVNDSHSVYQAKKLIEQDLDEYIFDDVSYKPNCPVKIIEASAKLAVAKSVAESGKKVVIVDEEEVLEMVKKEYGDLFEYRTY